MGLRTSYTLLAPIYDFIVQSATRRWRRASIDQLSINEKDLILLNGVGTGLDLEFLPPHGHYIATDLTPAMLKRAQARHAQLASAPPNIEFQICDACRLPYADQQFDAIILHLILAVVGQPADLLRECDRVLKSGGKIVIVDKFLRPNQRAPGRRLVNLFMRHIATRTDVVFEEVLTHCPALRIINDTTLAPGSWFRNIVLQKD